jgi:hypothetical protein
MIRLAPLALVFALLAWPAPAAAQQAAQLAPSLNWAGYVATNAYYSGVSALIEAPTPSSLQFLGVVASWVGIGGAAFGTRDLIQAGVQEINQGPFVAYQAWYELLPASERGVVMDIEPGAWVLVDIHEVAFNLWQITIVNGKNVWTDRFVYASSHTSAEWVVEEPSLASGRLLPLAGVTGANFANMAAIANGVHAIPAQLFPQGTAIVSPLGGIKAVPTALGPDGASFSVTTAQF